MSAYQTDEFIGRGFIEIHLFCTGDITEEKIKEFITTYSLPLVVDFNQVQTSPLFSTSWLIKYPICFFRQQRIVFE
jgi:hypothetical protein